MQEESDTLAPPTGASPQGRSEPPRILLRLSAVYTGDGQEQAATMAAQIGDLVRHAQSGDPAARASLVRTWEPIARRALRRLIADPFDADDVVQETLLRALKNVATLRDAGRSTQWLSSIARNTAISMMRTPHPQRLLEDVVPPPDAGDHNERARMRLLVRTAVGGLSPIRREAVVQHYYRGLSYAEAAAVMGVSTDTVRSRLQKARSALEEAVCTMAHHAPERYTLSAQDLATLRVVLEATTLDDRHPELQGVLLDTEGWAVATDGRRLIVRRIAGLRHLAVPVLLGPWRGADALLRASGSSLTIGPEVALFEEEHGDRHDIPVMNHRFPNYRAVIPMQNPICSFTVPANAVRLALDRIVPPTPISRCPMTIQLADGVLSLSVRWKDPRAEATVRISTPKCSCQAGLHSSSIDARFMDSCVRGLEPDDHDMVQVSMFGETGPVLFALPRRSEEVALVAPLASPGAA